MAAGTMSSPPERAGITSGASPEASCSGYLASG
ncbi:hypothetical protein PSN01_05397 [Micromonospora saelicesensis]|nr:hypothetical protein PSN01_05397 [Micromonospora saelicesensis]